MAAGTSAASWNRAVLRAWRGLIPRPLSRWVSLALLIGWPGWPPGNSQGDGPVAPMAAWPLRLAATARAAEATGKAVLGLERVIVQEPAGDVPPVLAVEDGCGAGPAGGGGKVAGGEAGGVRPADEPAGFFPVDGLAAGEPAVEVGLLAGAHCEVSGVEPVQERDGAAGQPAGQEDLLPGGGFPVVAAAHAPDQVPDQVAVQEPAPFRVGLEVQQAVEECLEPGHLLVTPGQRAGGDEGLA